MSCEKKLGSHKSVLFVFAWFVSLSFKNAHLSSVDLVKICVSLPTFLSFVHGDNTGQIMTLTQALMLQTTGNFCDSSFLVSSFDCKYWVFSSGSNRCQ